MQQSGKIRPALVVGAGAVALALGFGAGFAFTRGAAPEASAVGKIPAGVAPVVDSRVRYLIPVTDTQPQRGPKDALVTVVEWCDLRGDACRAADKVMSELMAEYAGRLRWTFRHLIDRDHFAQSQRIHAFARGAFQVGASPDAEKFWQARAKLLALPGSAIPDDAELRRIAEQIGVDYAAIDKGMEAKAYAGGLAIDTGFAARYGVKEAPGFFVNGRPVPQVPLHAMKAAIKALVEEELVEAERLVKTGIEAAQVYEELTKDGLWMVNEDRSKRPPPRVALQSAPRN